MEEMRTRILPRMLNDEAETYLTRNDVIIVPVGTVELHGGLPLDSETVISEAFALRMAEAADGLVLTGLPYFYAGATAIGRGTTQVSVREASTIWERLREVFSVRASSARFTSAFTAPPI